MSSLDITRVEAAPDAGRRAWDEQRPPELDLIRDCVHCGFCLPTCPSYAVFEDEADSPRGRIVLMRVGHEEGAEISPEMVTHFDRCLGCMACVTACPSGVQYDRLIEHTRPQLERHHERPWHRRALRRAVFELFTHPGRLRALAPLMAVERRLGLMQRAAELPVVQASPRLRTMLRLAPDVPARAALRRMPDVIGPTGGATRRGRVALMQGCVQRVWFADVNAATIRVLAAEGFEVVVPPGQGCCGALSIHAGREEESLGFARALIMAFETEDFDAVVVNAAGCGSHLKDFGRLFARDPDWADRAEAFRSRVRDVTEFLAALPAAASRHPIRARVAYHDACHLAHGQGIRLAPRELLRQIPGLTIAEIAGAEQCCGSAGIYNLTEPGSADAIGERKVDAVLAAKADLLASANPGCSLQIGRSLRRRGVSLPALHPIEILDASIGNRPLVLSPR
jgi:glycolate oxidase iron-sulfur subunit